jgi:O-antigen ligase
MMYWDYYGGVELSRQLVAFKTAHNGYLDTYLDGGALGLCCLAIFLLAIGRRAVREYLTGSQWGRLAFAFFVTMLLYNFAETTFGRRSALWFVFLLFALEVRGALPYWRFEESEPTTDRKMEGKDLLGVGDSKPLTSFR